MLSMASDLRMTLAVQLRSKSATAEYGVKTGNSGLLGENAAGSQADVNRALIKDRRAAIWASWHGDWAGLALSAINLVIVALALSAINPRVSIST
jgi:hypothetical protein